MPASKSTCNQQILSNLLTKLISMLDIEGKGKNGVYKRISTGVEGLDTITQGGYPARSNILIYGPNGVGKSLMCAQFVKEGLAAGESCLYITTKYNLDEVRTRMAQAGLDAIDYEKMGKLVIINPLTGETSGMEIGSQIDYVEISRSVTTIAKSINEAKRRLSGKIRVVFASLTGMLMDTSNDQMKEFWGIISTMIRRIRLQGHTAVYMLDPATDEQTTKRLRFMMDGFIELMIDLYGSESKRTLIIHHLEFVDAAIGKYDYKLLDTGIEVNPYVVS